MTAAVDRVPFRTVQPYGLRKLAADLDALGLRAGDALFVHSSFKSVGEIEGGAETLVRSMESVLGPEGLLLMPSFNLAPATNQARARSWRNGRGRSTVGWLTEYFRRMPGTVRSDHFSHAVAARGRGAVELVSEHLDRSGMQSPWDLPPWGRCYGNGSPLVKASRMARCKLLMLGVDYRSSTFCHVVEVMSWNRRRAANADAPYYWIDRDKAGAWWDSIGRLSRGRVGDADCRLFAVRDYVDSLLQAVENEPARFFKWYHGP